jgi:hypothetical protein
MWSTSAGETTTSKLFCYGTYRPNSCRWQNKPKNNSYKSTSHNAKIPPWPILTLDTYITSNWLTLRSRVFLEKLIIVHLLKKSPCLQEPTAGHYSRTAESSSPSRPVSLRFNLICSSRLHLGLPNGLFPSGLPTKMLYTFLVSPMGACYVSRQSHPSWFHYPNNISWQL